MDHNFDRRLTEEQDETFISNGSGQACTTMPKYV